MSKNIYNENLRCLPNFPPSCKHGESTPGNWSEIYKKKINATSETAHTMRFIVTDENTASEILTCSRARYSAAATRGPPATA
ncbi:hypothetical protein EVAR_59325_1 [Eumeta japonica]|uniref:Uncharacterized protein n=1 Tax=Eumeta variegata TaxID=151549 RepID=A0A4C1YRP2_EUMVA|nr:hypothetical protein EVAR_59325_1 [Eumeta japonica]